MLKGCQKQMIVLRGTGSEIFDEAYFILKSNEKDRRGGGRCYSAEENAAMLFEANRILEENRFSRPSRPAGYYALRYTLFFTAGVLLGAAFILLTLAIS
ncbi:MAG: hypothetical protein E7671_01705 [Ruminococcaceae bacterium]|nr:hypothetical protein [Oscillospiraceae bacterium]